MLLRPSALPEFKNDSKSEFVSLRQLPRVQSTTASPPALGRRPSEDLLNQLPELGHRVTLPPLYSISLRSSVATPSDLGSSKPNANFLPSIQSALGWFRLASSLPLGSVAYLRCASPCPVRDPQHRQFLLMGNSSLPISRPVRSHYTASPSAPKRPSKTLPAIPNRLPHSGADVPRHEK